MKKNNKLILIGLCLLLIVIAFFMIGKGKLIVSNENSSDISYIDEDKNYPNEIRLSFDYKDNETYSQKFKIQEGHEKNLSISENTLNKDIKVTLENKKGDILFKKDLKKKETISSFNKKYGEGEYVIKLSLTKNSKGSLEILIND